MGVLLLAIGFVSGVFTLVYGGTTLLVNAWKSRFGPPIPAEQLAPAVAPRLIHPAVASSLVDEAEAWLRSHPPGPDPTTTPGN
jgi:hypothetical protein